MKGFFNIVKRWDIIIIFFIILFSFLPYAVFGYQQSEKSDANSQYIAVISVDSKVVKKIPLTGHDGTELFDIAVSEGDTETIEVKDEEIRMKYATCSDQICVRTGFISKPSQTIVCLPHKMLIEVQTIEGSS